MEPRRTFALVNDGVAVWTFNADGTVQPPIVLHFGAITADDLEWATTEAKRLGLLREGDDA